MRITSTENTKGWDPPMVETCLLWKAGTILEWPLYRLNGRSLYVKCHPFGITFFFSREDLGWFLEVLMRFGLISPYSLSILFCTLEVGQKLAVLCWPADSWKRLTFIEPFTVHFSDLWILQALVNIYHLYLNSLSTYVCSWYTVPEINSEFTPENRGPLEVWRFLWEKTQFLGEKMLGFRECTCERHRFCLLQNDIFTPQLNAQRLWK